jgi:hypothetical protein
MEKMTSEDHNSVNILYYHLVGIICAFNLFGVLHDFIREMNTLSFKGIGNRSFIEFQERLLFLKE